MPPRHPPEVPPLYAGTAALLAWAWHLMQLELHKWDLAHALEGAGLSKAAGVEEVCVSWGGRGSGGSAWECERYLCTSGGSRGGHRRGVLSDCW